MKITELIKTLQELAKDNPEAEVFIKNTDPFIEEVNLYSKIIEVKEPSQTNNSFVTINI